MNFKSSVALRNCIATCHLEVIKMTKAVTMKTQATVFELLQFLKKTKRLDSSSSSGIIQRSNHLIRKVHVGSKFIPVVRSLLPNTRLSGVSSLFKDFNRAKWLQAK